MSTSWAKSSATSLAIWDAANTTILSRSLASTASRCTAFSPFKRHHSIALCIEKPTDGRETPLGKHHDLKGPDTPKGNDAQEALIFFHDSIARYLLNLLVVAYQTGATLFAPGPLPRLFLGDLVGYRVVR